MKEGGERGTTDDRINKLWIDSNQLSGYPQM